MQFIYLLYPFQTDKSCSTIRLMYQAIDYFHCIVGHPKPDNFELCLNVFEGLKHTTRYTVQKKSPVTVKTSTVTLEVSACPLLIYVQC